jgi:hypothetical protein
MHQTTFDTVARRAADLLDRRALFARASVPLVMIAGVPLAAEAKNKHKPGKNKRKRDKKLAKRCRRNLPGFCEGNQQCIDELSPCCHFLAKGKRGKADACCRESEFCPGAASSTGIG